MNALNTTPQSFHVYVYILLDTWPSPISLVVSVGVKHRVYFGTSHVAIKIYSVTDSKKYSL